MQFSSNKKLVVALSSSLVAILALVCLMTAQSGQCLQSSNNGGASPFGSSRPGSTLFEPTMSFIRQNMKLVEQYVALFRSIFVGAYDRPLITSTDQPVKPTRGPSPVVPPMDLPAGRH